MTQLKLFTSLELTVEDWCNNLTPTEVRQLIFLGVVAHPSKFTDPQSIADKWFAEWDKRGFNGLCPYAREYISKEFIKFQGDCAA